MTPRQFKSKKKFDRENFVFYVDDESQITPSISIEIKMLSKKIIASWSKEQKEKAYNWFLTTRRKLDDLKDELNDLLLP